MVTTVPISTVNVNSSDTETRRCGGRGGVTTASSPSTGPVDSASTSFMSSSRHYRRRTEPPNELAKYLRIDRRPCTVLASCIALDQVATEQLTAPTSSVNHTALVGACGCGSERERGRAYVGSVLVVHHRALASRVVDEPAREPDL